MKADTSTSDPFSNPQTCHCILRLHHDTLGPTSHHSQTSGVTATLPVMLQLMTNIGVR